MYYLLKGGMATRIATALDKIYFESDAKFVWLNIINECPINFEDIFLPNEKFVSQLSNEYNIVVGIDFSKQPDQKLMSQLLNDNFKFKPIIISLANQYPINIKTIGVHIRRKGIKAPKDTDIKNIELIDNKLDNGFETVFIASDDMAFKDFYIKRYGKRAIFINHNHFNRKTIHSMYVAAGDMLCLSRCGFIVRNGLYFSYISALFNVTPSQRRFRI